MKKELLEKIKITAEELKVVSIYLVGLDDGLLISDYDLILVLPNNSSKRKAARAFSSIDKKIDLRLVTNLEYFKNNYKYLPGTEMSLIYGPELRSSVKDTNKMKLIKMSAMFFKSFLRNYYRHSIANNINTVSLLKDLNDFNYCPKYLDDLPDNILAFIGKINNYRLNYNKISQVEARELLEEAIDNSWLLIEILNIELKKEFLIKNPKYIYFDLEPTIIIPSSVSYCRNLTEKSGNLFKKSKILYLPLGFQFIFSKDEIVINYIKNNLKHSFCSPIIFLKTSLKKGVSIFYYIELYLKGLVFKKYEKKIFD